MVAESCKGNLHGSEQVCDATVLLNGTNIFQCPSYAFLGCEVKTVNDLVPELGWKQAACKLSRRLKKTKDVRHRAHLWDSIVFPAQPYVSGSGTYKNRLNTRAASRRMESRKRCWQSYDSCK